MKNILLTGAGSGIGLSTAKLLAESGHRLILIGRNESKLAALAQAIGQNSKVYLCDVSSYEQVLSMSAFIQEEWSGKVNVVINNAGVGYFDTIEEGKITEWHQMLDTNVKGILNMLHAFLPMLIDTGGLIINIGSVASHQVFANSAIYAATKHAVWGISEGIRIELAGKVRVTTISPGAVNTPFIDQTSNEKMLKEYKEYFATALDPTMVAQQIKLAVELPDDVALTEVIIRPNRRVK
jgi:NADP-dependent 3-hydroxy acid dehydrogenase YdfG